MSAKARKVRPLFMRTRCFAPKPIPRPAKTKNKLFRFSRPTPSSTSIRSKVCPEHYYALAEGEANPDARVDAAESFFAATGANIREGGDAACYIPSLDRIHIPAFEAFRDAESYYATLAHEMTHWTRHESRLNRDFGRKRFGDEGYAQEELVAELGAAFLCADLKITLTEREDHASYIASWLKVLKNDNRAVFTAAAHAQRALDFLHEQQETRKAA